MVMLIVIFKAKKLPLSWCLGMDVFSEMDKNNFENNFGHGKRYPGLQLFCKDGTTIPIYFAASKKASMMGKVLTKSLRKWTFLASQKAVLTRMVSHAILT
jgi:hypothetical protein